MTHLRAILRRFCAHFRSGILAHGDAREYDRLLLEDGGFSYWKGGVEHFAVRWADVRSIAAFKRDFGTWDLICLVLESDGNQYVEIREHMINFMCVCERMRAEFPAIPEDWYLKVMSPAFAENRQVLWSADASR